MAPLEKARRHFGGGGGNEKKGQRKRLYKEKRGFQIAKRAAQGTRGTKLALLTSL
jgi:hypothetical protein